MITPTPIVFLGSDEFALPALKFLVDHYDVLAVITRQTKQGNDNPVKTWAEKNRLKVFEPDGKVSLTKILKSIPARVSILVNYGLILESEALRYYPSGILNLHPSLLPKYRGPSPIETTILNNDGITGVSLIKLVSELDAGPIFAVAEHILVGNENKPALYEALSNLCVRLLRNDLENILNKKLVPTAQDEHMATYTAKLTKQQGQIDWTKPAEILEREIRAYLGWPTSYTEISGRRIIILKSKADNALSGECGKFFRSNDNLGVYCGQGALIIHELKPAGKVAMSAKTFLAGLPNLV